MITIEEKKEVTLDICRQKADHIIKIYNRLVHYLWELRDDIDEETGDELLDHLDNWNDSDFNRMLDTLIAKIEKYQTKDPETEFNYKNRL